MGSHKGAHHKGSGTSSGNGEAPGRRGSTSMKYIVMVVLPVFGAAGLALLYSIIFPDAPTALALTDNAALHRVFYSGAPHLVLCGGTGKVVEEATAAVTNALPLLRADGVEAVVVDCSSPVPSSGVALADRFRINTGWHPTWFVTANGKRPEQLTPQLARAPRKELVEAVTKVAANRPATLANLADWTACIRDRVGGCVFVYTRRPKADVLDQLAGAMAANRTVRFGVLDAGILALQGRTGSAADRLVKAAVAAAREAAAAVAGADGATRPELVISARRAPRDVAGDDPDAILVTVGQVATPGLSTAADIAALLTNASAAVSLLTSTGAGDVDAMLERDDRLAGVASVLATKGDFVIQRAVVRRKAPAAAAAGASEDGEPAHETRADRRDRRAARRARAAARAAARAEAGTVAPPPAGGAAPPAGGKTPAEVAAERAAAERQRREEMAREEAESGHVAFLAEEDEDGDDYGGGGGDATTLIDEVLELDEDDDGDADDDDSQL